MSEIKRGAPPPPPDDLCTECPALKAELARVKQERAELDAAMKEVTGKLLNQMAPGLRELDQAKEAGARSAFEMAAVEITTAMPEWSNEAPRRIVRECKVNAWMAEWLKREAGK